MPVPVPVPRPPSGLRTALCRCLAPPRLPAGPPPHCPDAVPLPVVGSSRRRAPLPAAAQTVVPLGARGSCGAVDPGRATLAGAAGPPPGPPSHPLGAVRLSVGRPAAARPARAAAVAASPAAAPPPPCRCRPRHRQAAAGAPAAAPSPPPSPRRRAARPPPGASLSAPVAALPPPCLACRPGCRAAGAPSRPHAGRRVAGARPVPTLLRPVGDRRGAAAAGPGFTSPRRTAAVPGSRRAAAAVPPGTAWRPPASSGGPRLCRRLVLPPEVRRGVSFLLRRPLSTGTVPLCCRCAVGLPVGLPCRPFAASGAATRFPARSSPGGAVCLPVCAAACLVPVAPPAHRPGRRRAAAALPPPRRAAPPGPVPLHLRPAPPPSRHCSAVPLPRFGSGGPLSGVQDAEFGVRPAHRTRRHPIGQRPARRPLRHPGAPPAHAAGPRCTAVGVQPAPVAPLLRCLAVPIARRPSATCRRAAAAVGPPYGFAAVGSPCRLSVGPAACPPRPPTEARMGTGRSVGCRAAPPVPAAARGVAARMLSCPCRPAAPFRCCSGRAGPRCVVVVRRSLLIVSECGSEASQADDAAGELE